MDTDLLPPEEDQKTRETDQLEEAYNKPAIEDFRRSNGPPPKMQQAKKAAGFVVKNKKWFIGGGAGAGIFLALAMFIAWMMLFKSVHIKNLYITYRWAQFNRGLNKAVKAQLEYAKDNPDTAKPSGGADSIVDSDAAPDEISRQTNKDAGPDTTDPDVEADKLNSFEESVEGSSEKALTDAGSDRKLPAAEGTGDTPEAQAKSARQKAEANVEDELTRNKSLDGKAPESINDGVEEAQKQEQAGKTAREAALEGAEKVTNSGGWKGALQKTGGLLNIATFYCIFHDIYSSAKDQVIKIALDGAMGASQLLNKTADCQKIGNCDANQIGAVVDKFDNDKESFSESCGYQRAEQQPTVDCKEIDPQFIVNGVAGIVGGPAKTGIVTADALLDPPLSFKIGAVKADPSSACKVVMSPLTQILATGLNIGLLATSGGSWGAVTEAAGQGAVVFAGTMGGKALIASTIMKYSHNLYKFLTPHDMGNLMDMGNMATASASCIQAYCPQATDKQLGELDREYRQERIAANSKKSIIGKFFDNNSPDSVVSRVALNAPATPTAIIGRLKNIFGTISNPVKISLSVGKNSLALAGNQTAYAETDTGASVYGLKDKVAVPPNLFSDSADYATVIKWGKNRDVSAIESSLSSCIGDKSESYSKIVSKGSSTCLWSSMSSDQKMYTQYKYYQKVAYHRALLHNNQTNLTSSSGSSSPTTADTTGVKRGEDTAGRPCPSGTTSAGTAKTFAGANIQLCNIGDNTVVNQSAAKAFYDMKQAAAQDRITLYGGGFRSYEEQIALRKAHCDDWQNTPANSCRPPTALPGRSMHEEGLAVDFKNSSSRGTAVYAWLSANASRFGISNLPSEPWHWSVSGH